MKRTISDAAPTTLTEWQAHAWRLENALKRVEGICKASEAAYPDIPQAARTALRIHIKDTRLVIADALGDES